jgi:Piwi domain
MCRVTPRILNGPSVEYLSCRPHNPSPIAIKNYEISNGAWNLKDRRFCRTGENTGNRVAWSVLQLMRRGRGGQPPRSIPRGDLVGWYNAVSGHLAESGIPGQTGFSGHHDSVHELDVTYQSSPTDITNDETNLAKKIDEMRKECKATHNMDLELIFILLPEKDIPLYALVKRVGDQTTGMRTVCHVYKFKGKSMSNPDRNVVGNLAQKVNIKICPNGVNQRLSGDHGDHILTDDTMLMGADVTHAGFGAISGAPSIAAVVGSVDECFAQFPASLRVNPRLDVVPGRPHASVNERITELDRMVAERIRRYTDRRGKFPKKLIFFRDGLSEAQLDMCRNQELPLIREGITQAKGDSTDIPDPQILLICTVKRHHKRFFSDQNDLGNGTMLFDQNGNPRPGCMIDNTVVNEAGKDFFLYSHSAIKGTAKPTHYVVLHNDNNHSLNHIAAMVRIPPNLTFPFVILLSYPSTMNLLTAYHHRRTPFATSISAPLGQSALLHQPTTPTLRPIELVATSATSTVHFNSIMLRFTTRTIPIML